jgi:hypothetical protein
MARYPVYSLSIGPFESVSGLLDSTIRLVGDDWPPPQALYLDEYLTKLGCKTYVLEPHYIDRDYIADVAAFYSRCLFNYPNFCRRLHLFRQEFDVDKWKSWIAEATGERLKEIEQALNADYLGYVVLRPLDGCPVGRSVLEVYPADTANPGHTRFFGAIKPYRAHLGPFHLSVDGLPFQQQDQGVSACATTALWTSLQKVAPMERRSPPTPAEITEAASRYLLLTGRALPSGGLGIQQMCEAIRGSGFEPVLIRSLDVSSDKAQLLAYLQSGFAPVLCIQGINGGSVGHAVCLAGVELADTVPPALLPGLRYRREADSITGLYVHDDRLGPYARAEIAPLTLPANKAIVTGVSIRGPGEDASLFEENYLSVIVVPVPEKIRLNVGRILEVGQVIGQAIGSTLPADSEPLILGAHYVTAMKYRREATEFGLSEEGNFKLQFELTLPRYLAVAQLRLGNSVLADVLLDSTETEANPAQVALVLRSHAISDDLIDTIVGMADVLGVEFIS